MIFLISKCKHVHPDSIFHDNSHLMFLCQSQFTQRYRFWHTPSLFFPSWNTQIRLSPWPTTWMKVLLTGSPTSTPTPALEHSSNYFLLLALLASGQHPVLPFYLPYRTHYLNLIFESKHLLLVLRLPYRLCFSLDQWFLLSGFYLLVCLVAFVFNLFLSCVCVRVYTHVCVNMPVCVCGYKFAMVHMWQSENKLRCWSLPFIPKQSDSLQHMTG